MNITDTLQQWSTKDQKLGSNLAFLKHKRKELNDLITVIECQRGNIARYLMSGNIDQLNQLSDCQTVIETQIQKLS